MEIITSRFNKLYKLKELDAGDVGRIKVKPMSFVIRHYEVEDIGHFVIMQGKAMLGLMKMDTVILTPTKKDAPLFSYDRIKAMGNDTYIIELYDTLINKDLRNDYDALESVKGQLSSIDDHDLGSHWYDPLKLKASHAKKGKNCSDLLDSGYESFFNAYLDKLKDAPDCDQTVKIAKTAEYVNGLFDNGGPATDAYVKAMGRPAAEKIFKTVIFGLEQ